MHIEVKFSFDNVIVGMFRIAALTRVPTRYPIPRKVKIIPNSASLRFKMIEIIGSDAPNDAEEAP